jgi:hypothetical protein
MSGEVFITLGGHELQALALRVGAVGPWMADCDLTDDTPLAGKQLLKIGAQSFVGTVVAPQAGTFALTRRLRLVAGAGGWSSYLTPRAYHSDAGVRAQLIAQDAAREVGESLDHFAPAAPNVGNDYVRGRELAAAVLEHAAGGVPWWVDYAGLTQVGQRPAPVLAAADYTLLDFDGRSRIAVLTSDDLDKLPVGAVIQDKRLDAPQTIRDLEYGFARGQPPRIVAWCGGSSSSASRLAELLRAVIDRTHDEPLHGVYRYRVVSEAADTRCDLQATRKGAGLPDLRHISQWPGVAGVASKLTLGAEVLVQFVEGDRAQPILTGYAGKDGVGFVPLETVIGGEPAPAAARVGDAVMLPSGVFNGTITGVGPATGTITFTDTGTISTGSSKVRIG